MSSADSIGAVALFAFLAVGAVALFSFIAVASWSDNRRKERESYYKNDMLKKLAESSGAGATAAMELMREEDRLQVVRKRQDMKVGGMVVFGTGIGVLAFLYMLLPHQPIYMVGVLLMMVGASLYGGSYLLTASGE